MILLQRQNNSPPRAGRPWDVGCGWESCNKVATWGEIWQERWKPSTVAFPPLPPVKQRQQPSERTPPPPLSPLKLPLYVNLWKAAVFLCLFHLLRKRSTLTQTHRNAEPVKKGRSQLSEGEEIIFFSPAHHKSLSCLFVRQFRDSRARARARACVCVFLFADS